MQVKILKWGNSLALRIPRAFANEIKVSENSKVDLTIDKGMLKIEPIIEYEAPQLNDLLEKVNEDNIHYEIDTGKPRGKEVW